MRVLEGVRTCMSECECEGSVSVEVIDSGA